jgi:hypothetical protein
MTRRRLTVHDAARRLGISEDAVRMRVKRDTLEAEREGGRLYVLLDEDLTSEPTDRTGELVDLLRAQLEDLRSDRDAWRDQARRSDYLASTAMDRTRELEGRLREIEAGPDTEARESPESPGPIHTPTNTAGAPETGTQRTPWWRRMFRG